MISAQQTPVVSHDEQPAAASSHLDEPMYKFINNPQIRTADDPVDAIPM